MSKSFTFKKCSDTPTKGVQVAKCNDCAGPMRCKPGNNYLNCSNCGTVIDKDYYLEEKQIIERTRKRK